MELTVTVNAPAIADAINNLAAAISSARGTVLEASTVIDTQKVPVQNKVPLVPVNSPETATQKEIVPDPGSSSQPASVPVPAPTTKPITLEALCEAGARLVEGGHMDQVIALLGKYGVQAINQLAPENYDALAADLRTIGATI